MCESARSSRGALRSGSRRVWLTRRCCAVAQSGPARQKDQGVKDFPPGLFLVLPSCLVIAWLPAERMG